MEFEIAASSDAQNRVRIFAEPANSQCAYQANVLLVEDDPVVASAIRGLFAGAEGCSFCVDWVVQFSEARQRLRHGSIDVVLFELALDGCAGIEAIAQIRQLAPGAAVLVLCNADNEERAREAVQHGAHDYLVKDRGDVGWWPRVLRYIVESRLAKEMLLKSEARFHTLSDASSLGIFISDAEGVCVYTNDAYHRISGMTFAQTRATCWSMVIHPEDRDCITAKWREVLRNRSSFQAEARLLRANRSVVWARLEITAMHEFAGTDGEFSSRGHALTVEDITAKKSTERVLQAAENALFEEQQRALVTLNSIGDAVLTTDLAGRVTGLNPTAEAMTGWSRKEALGQPSERVFNVIDGVTSEIVANPAQRAIEENRSVALAMDSVLVHRDGSESAIEDSATPIHDREGAVAGAVIVFHDASQSRMTTSRMAHLAQHDFLTGLPNRALLMERLLQSISLAHRHGTQVALVFLDLDFFKHINDSLGHIVGDQLLQSAAERMEACVRTSDTVCRLGGDEFVILLAEIEQREDAALVAEKLLAAFVAPHGIGEHEIHLTLSIGVSVYPYDGMDADILMQNADAAMYYAKTNGRNNYKFFLPEMNARVVQRLFVKSSLQRALRDEEFLLHYQSQVDLNSGEVVGVEALLRWQDADFGLVYPAQFIQVAEESGLIIPIGMWMLREACRQVRAWLQQGLRVVPVAVNISALQFRQKGFVEAVAAILRETGLAPYYLELELTESALIYDADASVAVLNALRGVGVRLAIDHFGTGYSSLSYLTLFSVDSLKIDASFLSNIGAGTENAAIVSAVFDIGRNLGMRVVAEGVETAEQLEFLRSRHCNQGQGYAFSYPLPAADFVLLLPIDNAL